MLQKSLMYCELSKKYHFILLRNMFLIKHTDTCVYIFFSNVLNQHTEHVYTVLNQHTDTRVYSFESAYWSMYIQFWILNEPKNGIKTFLFWTEQGTSYNCFYWRKTFSLWKKDFIFYYKLIKYRNKRGKNCDLSILKLLLNADKNLAENGFLLILHKIFMGRFCTS